MKNIHLLPTNKPSRLVKIYNDVNRETFTLKLDVEVNDSFKEYVNVYVTSDEEIKDVRPYKGNWHLEKENILNKFPDYLTDLSECKLVIMTTDKDLIKDGVQPIPDEFSEWFINNVSCEEVEVVDVRSLGIYGSYYPYKIIIPKEEDFELVSIGEETIKLTIPMIQDKEEHKQETVEEAKINNLIKLFGKDFDLESSDTIKNCNVSFEAGAKWLQERMYSEKEVHSIIKSYHNTVKNNPINTTYSKWFEQYKKN